MHYPPSQIENSEPICCTKHAHFQHSGDMPSSSRKYQDLKTFGLQAEKTILGKNDGHVNYSRKGKKRKRANVVVPISNGPNLNDLFEIKSMNWKQKSPRKTAIVPPRPRQQYRLAGSSGWVYNVSQVEYGRNTPVRASSRSHGMSCQHPIDTHWFHLVLKEW